jgi:hypothetical protein
VGDGFVNAYAFVNLKASECTLDGRLASGVRRTTRGVECSECGGVCHGLTKFKESLGPELVEEVGACLHLQRLERNGKLVVCCGRNIHDATREAGES